MQSFDDDGDVQLTDEQLRTLLALEEDASGKVRTDALIQADVDAYTQSLQSWRVGHGRAPAGDSGDEADAQEEQGPVDSTAGDGAGVKASPSKKKKMKSAAGGAAKPKVLGLAKKRAGSSMSSAATEKENLRQASSSSSVMLKGSRPTGLYAASREPFSFATLVKQVLVPEDRASGDDCVADALLAATHIHLEASGLADSTMLECLGGATHCYLQHNLLTHVEGCEMMFRLTVAVFHHNNVTSLAPLAALPCLTFLDASYNAIAELDVELHLPCEPLRSINLTGNPCAPDYDLLRTNAADAEQVAYLQTYLAALARCCRHLRHVDGQPLAVDGNAPVEDGHMLQTMAAEQALEAAAMDGSDAAADGHALITNFRDADFYDEANIPSAVALAGDDGEVEAGGAGGDGSSGDDEPAAPSSKPLGLRKNSNSGGTRRTGAPTAAASSGGGASHVQSITSSLLARYQTACDSKHDAMLQAVGASDVPDVDMLVVPNDDDDDEQDGDDADAPSKAPAAVGAPAGELQFAGTEGYRRAAASQVALRTELRFAQNHQSQLALMLVANGWNDVEQRLQRRQEDALERRGRMVEAMRRPSAAYLAALETLTQESGGKGLDHFRQAAAKPPAAAAAAASSAPAE